MTDLDEFLGAAHSIGGGMIDAQTESRTMSGDHCQVIFLDIDLRDKFDGMTGMELAHRLREIGYSGEIVFTTCFSAYACEGYEVAALRYLVKPIQNDKLACCLKLIASRHLSCRWLFNAGTEKYCYRFRDIYYFKAFP